jgi:hypothetical protein
MEDQEQQDATKMQMAFMLRRYQPQQGRADRHASNIPGGTSEWGGNADHTIGHGGSN